MLTIRLQRTGKRNRPSFRVVVAEKESHVSKKITEVLGAYDPRTKDFKVNEERVKYWLAQRTELSPTMHNLLVAKGLLDAKKVKAFSTPKKEQSSEPAAPGSVQTASGDEALADKPAAEAAPAVEEIKPENNPETPEEVQTSPQQA